MTLLVLPDPEECIYCIALGWWKRRRICCDNGLVFIFPPKKLPGTIKQVFTSKLPKFRKMKKNVIRLNGCLSFGSIQTTFIQSNKFGVQVIFLLSNRSYSTIYRSQKFKGLSIISPLALCPTMDADRFMETYTSLKEMKLTSWDTVLTVTSIKK